MEGVERGDGVADIVLFNCGVVEFVVDQQIHSKLVNNRDIGTLPVN